VILHDARPPGSGTDSGDEPSAAGIDRPGHGSRGDRASRLVEEFVAAWTRGDVSRAEIFLDRHPRLKLQPEAAIRLIYEEVCLCQGEGEQVAVAELVQRFPQWQTELEVLLDCDRLLGALPGQPTFPAVGESLGDFELLAELGRGARGRCFLAAQPSLSNRQVVLKVTPLDHVEHLSLARLQHTHIMPLYSEHEFPARRLRALCMPDLGGATLARILADLSGTPAESRSGRSLLDVLDGSRQPGPWPRSERSPALRFLAQSSYVRAACWIGSCLADALQYAHDRGLVHMDVKPSNILLTDDGQPMLLDFHLAREPIAIDDLPTDGVGGTPGYMSPEQEAVVAAIDSGSAVRSGIDARSDLYSLGRVLAEMLGAGDRDPAGARATRSHRFPPGVSTGLADVIRKCLAADPGDRYPDAAALAEDLRRHMADLPLCGVSNRDLRERWLKWCRRQPHEVFRLKTLSVATGAILALTAAFWLAVVAPRFRDANDALVAGRILLDRRDYPEAARTLTRGAALIEGLPGGDRLTRELAGALAAADRLDETDRLHRLVDRLRFAEAAADRRVASARDVERHCRALWGSRRALLEGPGAALEGRLRQQLLDDLLDLAIIGSSLRVRLAAEAGERDEAHRAALGLLDEVESWLGPSHVLYRARQGHAAALGLSERALAAARWAEQMAPRTAWEFDAAGRVLLADDDLTRAQAAFERALDLRPQDFWPNFHRGLCAYRRGRYPEALTAFSVCVAIAPDEAECFYNRGLTHAALGHSLEATRDRDRAISLDSTLAVPPEPPTPRRASPTFQSVSRRGQDAAPSP
jgi:serine/threonine protein kinase